MLSQKEKQALWKCPLHNHSVLRKKKSVLGLHFHVVGEGVVRVRSSRQERVYDRENYIDFRMRLLGEPGILNFGNFIFIVSNNYQYFRTSPNSIISRNS